MFRISILVLSQFSGSPITMILSTTSTCLAFSATNHLLVVVLFPTDLHSRS